MKTKKTLTALALGLIGAFSIAKAQDLVWKEYELRTKEEAIQIYRDKIPSNLFYSLEELDLAHRYNTENLRVQIGTGTFGDWNYKDSECNLELLGAGKDKTNLRTKLSSFENIYISGINFESGDINNLEYSIVGSTNGTIIKNCRFPNYSYLVADTRFNTEITDNEFINFNNLLFPESIASALNLVDFGLVNDKPIETNAIIKRNLFKDCIKGITLYLNADLGTPADAGENIFDNCGTAIENYYNGTLWAMDNYIITNDAITKIDGSKRVILTLEDALETGQIINEGGEIHFSGLPYRPIPECDWDDNKKVDAVDVQLVINSALGNYDNYFEYPDWDKNRRIDAVDIQATINKVLDIKCK